MIYFIVGAALGVIAFRSWRRERAAARDMASRFVHRDPSLRYAPPPSNAELVASFRDRLEEVHSAQYRRELERKRYLHRLNNPELYS